MKIVRLLTIHSQCFLVPKDERLVPIDTFTPKDPWDRTKTTLHGTGIFTYIGVV